jgi:CxxC motif-containing protein
MNKYELVCIACPQGCRLSAVKKDGVFEFTGNKCKKGLAYGEQELTCPMRSITTTVRTAFDDFPVVPVKTSGDIPLEKIFSFMKIINDVKVSERLKPGDVIIENLLDSGVDLVATANMEAL